MGTVWVGQKNAAEARSVVTYPPDVLSATTVRPRVGGLQTFVNGLASALREHELRVGVLTPLGYSAEFMARGGVDRLARSTLATTPPLALGLYAVAQALIAARLLVLSARGRPRVIHCMDVAAANALRPIAKALNVPVALTVHGYLRQTMPESLMNSLAGALLARFYDREERCACRAARLLTAVSASRADTAHADAGRMARVIPNFVNTDQFRPAPPGERPRGGELEGELLLGYVGVLERLKGLHVALDALARAPASIRLEIVGDGPARAELEQQARTLGLMRETRRVTFRGTVPHQQTVGIYQHLDAFLLPSVEHLGVSEAAPLALLEASACGAPVVCSAIGGMAEIVEEGVTGLMFPQGDAAALARVLVRLKDDAALRRRLGEAAVERVRTRHSHRSAAKAYLALYEEMLGGALRPPR
ncbi:MAG: glycosyltransferase family 4 protein [Chloroflexi bacterium]|nr:glycosyltransferase family 4 protein [Chloroflexota bacterium]